MSGGCFQCTTLRKNSKEPLAIKYEKLGFTQTKKKQITFKTTALFQMFHDMAI